MNLDTVTEYCITDRLPACDRVQAVLDRQVTQHAGVDLVTVDATPSRGHSTVGDETHFRCRQLQGKRRRDSVMCILNAILTLAVAIST